MSDRAPVLQTAGLCKSFRDFWRRPRVEAVQDLNLEIRPGEVFGLLGPNGSGKTTTIKMLLGLLYPTRGRISIFGKPPTDVAVKARIGFLPEESYLYRYLDGSETLDYFGRLFLLPTRVRRERTERLLDMVGLRQEAKRPVGEYSKGMARRIGLAQALINDPELLILDEPTSGLDPIGAHQIKEVIRELGRKGKTILLSSHILADVEDVCDRVTILYGGQERETGDMDTLLREESLTQITTPPLAPATLEQVRGLIRRLESKEVLNVTHPRVRLEEFFLRIVREAQAANLHTHGARSGGDMPDFLSKATDMTPRGVVDELVTAGRRVEPIAPKPKPIVPGDDSSRRVIDDLLGRRVSQGDGAVKADRAAPIQVPEPRRAKPQADRGVIDDLLKGSSPGSGTSSETKP